VRLLERSNHANSAPLQRIPLLCRVETVLSQAARNEMKQLMKKDPAPASQLNLFGDVDEYSQKRRFDVRPEPAGKPGRARKDSLEFVIQKHRASHLHYDFRLEHNGVMLSWAVPKGPSLDPANKRFAVQTRDHPIEYNRFEGVIPEGDYGGGTVMIWDRGTWEPEVDDVDAALAKGEVKFTLHGTKLSGSWVLVRMRDRQWLLVKHRDKAASTLDIVVARPRSAVSNETLAGIARGAGATRHQLKQAEEADQIMTQNSASFF
jgi:DNA ligase D-like protein (predicted 3'-phosphoesterase)